MTPAQPTAENAGDIGAHVHGVLALYGGAANVVLQFTRPGVAWGVIESPVESGAVTKHPFKRGRTTLTYIAVALIGTDQDRADYRRYVDEVHRQVRSRPSSPVKYNAFDRDLQLWVAACLHYGYVDTYTRTQGGLDDATRALIHSHSARFGTTLQVPADRWPTDPDAFDDYIETCLDAEFDPEVRDYLVDLMKFRQMPAWFWPAGRFLEFMNTGYLPAPLRAQLGLTWSPRRERIFTQVNRTTGRIVSALPRAARQFPFNYYLWFMRRRIRRGKSPL
ncbi:uncharacterized protein (DUF2236 family) [Nocardioides daedukensis]|uniref:Uncharacterized protein (DUF2236 family) n=1 Tax=Nocardioides daedukensis TaxID=634462 RepID=A0A7Y9S5K5_9ACTN|nr:oxygenase MpaB family protein [Nocardioides daedukensis]NYG60159.1 uncharacterized protein (DUF2236 family) [Nocardioides daedukensis]